MLGMNPFTARIMAQLALQRRQQEQEYERPTYEPFDPYQDEETKRRARNAGMSALLGGLLNAQLNRGQGMGDALTAQREATQGVRDRAVELNRIRVQDERQRHQDELYEESRRSEIENRRIDNERAQREADAKETAAKEKAEVEQRERQREIEQNRKLVERVRSVNPTLADQLSELVESERFPVGEAVGASAPKPREAEHGRWDVDSKGRQVYFPPDGGPPQYKGRLSPDFADEDGGDREAAITKEADAIADAWIAAKEKRGAMVTADDIQAIRRESRRRAEENYRLTHGSSAPPPGSRLRFNSATGELE